MLTKRNLHLTLVLMILVAMMSIPCHAQRRHVKKADSPAEVAAPATDKIEKVVRKGMDHTAFIARSLKEKADKYINDDPFEKVEKKLVTF